MTPRPTKPIARAPAPIAFSPSVMNASQRLVRTVAERLTLGMLAAAEEYGLRLRGVVLHRRESRPLVRAVAEGLILAEAAGAPEIGLPRHHLDLERRLLRYVGLGHR